MNIFKILEGAESEISICDDTFEITLINGNIKIRADIEGIDSRLTADTIIPIEIFTALLNEFNAATAATK